MQETAIDPGRMQYRSGYRRTRTDNMSGFNGPYNERISDEEKAHRHGYWWAHLASAIAPPPAVGTFGGGFRTLGFVGTGGSTQTMADKDLLRFAINPWSKYSPIWLATLDTYDPSGPQYDVRDTAPWQVGVKEAISGGLEIIPGNPTATSDNQLMSSDSVGASIAADPLICVDRSDTSITNECTMDLSGAIGSGVQRVNIRPLEYTAPTPGQLGFVDEHDWAFFMGGYITVKVSVPQFSSVSVTCIGQNELRGVGLGNIFVGPGGTPINGGDSCDPNKIDFQIIDTAFKWGGLAQMKPQTTSIGGGNNPTESFFTIPVIPSADGAYLMVGGAQSLGPSIHYGQGDNVDSDWMAVLSHNAPVGQYGYSYETALSAVSRSSLPYMFHGSDSKDRYGSLDATNNTKPAMAFYSNMGLMMHNQCDQIGQGVPIQQNIQIDAGGTMFANPPGVTNNFPSWVDIGAPAQGTGAYGATNGIIDWQGGSVNRATGVYVIKGGNANVYATSQREGSVYRVRWDAHYRTRRATASIAQSLISGMPQIELFAHGGSLGSIQIDIRYKFFYQYIIDINHPLFEQAIENNIEDINVDQYRLQAAPVTGSGSTEAAAIESSRLQAIERSDAITRKLLDASHSTAKMVIPRSGITQPVKHDEPSFMDKLFGGAASIGKSIWNTGTTAAKWLWKNSDTIGKGIVQAYNMAKPYLNDAAKGLASPSGPQAMEQADEGE